MGQVPSTKKVRTTRGRGGSIRAKARTASRSSLEWKADAEPHVVSVRPAISEVVQGRVECLLANCLARAVSRYSYLDVSGPGHRRSGAVWYARRSVIFGSDNAYAAQIT